MPAEIKICLISYPYPKDYLNKPEKVYSTKAWYEIFENLAVGLKIICGNYPIPYENSDNYIDMNIRIDHPNIFCRVIKNIEIQIKVLKLVRRYLSKNHNIFIFLRSAPIFVLPLFYLKLKNKPTVIFLAGSMENAYNNNKILFNLLHILSNISYTLSTSIVPYTPKLAEFMKLEKFNYKIIPKGLRYIDTNSFNKQTQFNERNYTLTFVGRLTRGKGLESLILALKECPVKTVICGDGELREDIERLVSEYGDRIDYLGWVEPNNLIDIYNNSKFIILPSDSEGVPYSILQAMACGTIPICTPVGGIPDVIKDYKTGFILSDNSVDSIKAKIQEILKLNECELIDISENAVNFIKENLSFEAAKERYRYIIDKTLEFHRERK